MHARALIAACGLLAAGTACADTLLDRLQSGAPLRVCTTGDYRPYSYAKSDGTYEGIDIDLTHSLARSLGTKVDWVRTSWPTLMSDFTAGKCDMAVGGVSVTLERQKKASFSTAYMVDGKTPITRCEDAARFQTLAEIDRPEVRVIVNPGGTNERYARSHLKQAQLSVYPDNVTIFQQLVDRKADVMITDASETLLQHKLHPQLCSVHPDQPFQYGEKALLLPRDDAPFRAYVDQWLHLAVQTGEFARIRDAWLK